MTIFSGPSAAHPRPAGLKRKDYAGLLLLVAALYVAAYLQSGSNPLWSDEIIGYLVFHQPSLARTLELWRHGLDSGGIWYEITGRWWISVFGPSALAERLFSATGVAGAAIALWAAARRLYSFPVVAASVAYLFANSLVIRWQLANGRTYGFFLFAVALVLYFVIRSGDEDQLRPSPAFLLATFGANVLLAGSHILGVVYVIVCLAAQVALDRYQGRFRPKLYLAALCSEVVLFLELPNIKATMAVGKPSFWTVAPRYKDLIRLKWILDSRVSLLLLVLVVLAILFQQFRLRRRHAPVYFVIASFACFGICLFAYSRVGTSIYVDRYMIPFSLVGGLALCEVLAMVVNFPGRLGTARYAFPSLVAAVAVAGFFLPRFQRPSLPLADSWPEIASDLPPNVAIVSPAIGAFLAIDFFHHNPGGRQIVFPTDWGVALDRETTGGVSGFHEMDNLHRYGIFGDDIEPTAAFLSSHRDFAVLTDPPNVWLRRRILSDPRYVVEQYSTHPAAFEGHPLTVYLVHTR